MSAGAVPAGERDPFDARLVLAASGALREFNRAGVLSASDVHVARRLGALGGESSETVLLAAALAVRAPRIGHVLVDLASIAETAAVDTEDPIDLDALRWPAPAEWVAAVAASPLVAREGASELVPREGASALAAREGADGDVRPLRLRGSWLYLDRYWSEELAVAGALRALLDRPAEPVDEARLAEGIARLFPGETDGRQAAAAAAAVRRRCAVIAGGPGTGKTTTVARIVALLLEQADGGAPLVALAAPTGKAAARLEEAVHAEARSLAVPEPVRKALLGLGATTIHRLLGWRPGTNSRFRHDAHRRLAHDVVIIDETSMVSLSLMARLIEALRTGARLVLVGDPGQLASIEAGAVLGDIVGGDGDAPRGPGGGDRRGARGPDGGDRRDAQGPDCVGGGDVRGAGAGGPSRAGIVVLDRGHRFGGTIAPLAAAIREGDGDAVMELLRSGAEDVTWIDAEAGQPEPAVAVRTEALAAAGAVAEAARIGAAPDAVRALGACRILCAHRRGPSGVASWNVRAEGWLEDAVAGFSAAERWYVGRPLLVTENDRELGLANGDTGVIVQVGEGRVMAAFERGGELVLHPPSRLGAVDTVYAMTIHKSQGSQFAVAAVLLPEPGSRILTRELLYTAATRAQRRLILVGPEETVRAAVERRVARASGLAARLWG
ncbi:MAG TPA: exodeoxyribonuclease V subunit alpha [Solirubrobacteraceae bacterium]|nr:exodeoxyribonuclease V subunit alpha [Solirubrobacteraceae bacterium]